tara:strand:- start:19435 stop:21699 length:2265 start_codon:yes stop_codon:yes gene_type:complete
MLLRYLIEKTVFCLFFLSWLPVSSLAEGQALQESNKQPNTVVNPVDVQAPFQETASSIGRAVSLELPLNLDGILDESIYTIVQPMSDFIQVEPTEGLPATEVTEVWVFFDEDHIYFVARCWETEPDRLMVDEMRRDNTNIGRGDNVAWIFDTLYDQRTGVLFEVNALGGRMDGQSTGEGRTNFDWNPIWEVEVGRFEQGWTVEAAVPFKSLRYRPGDDQTWGINVRRRNRWKNEMSYLVEVPAAVGGRGLRASLAAPLVGIKTPPPSRNIEIKPYAISELNTDAKDRPAPQNDFGAEAGIDLKIGITESVTADLTYNTDFAQVEADEQQINLTRFSLFFPEKRDFFLENQGTFSFGGRGRDTPVVFYSRRIGLQGGREVPVTAGGRVTGRAGGFDLGLLHIRADKEVLSGAAPTNFSVVRLKRDIFRQSSVGLIATDRSVSLNKSGRNRVYGVDGDFLFLQNTLVIDTYWAKSETDKLDGNNSSYRLNFNFDGDKYGVRLERLVVGDAFNPEIGFVRRDDMQKSRARFRFSPRLFSVQSIRKLVWAASINYVENMTGQLETRESYAEFGVDFENSDRFRFRYRRTYEFLPEPFQITPSIVLPVKNYDFSNYRIQYNLWSQRLIKLDLEVERGQFFSGHRTAVSVRRGRWNPTPRFAIEPSYSVNWINLLEGEFTTHLTGARVVFTTTPKMFTSALLQYSSESNTAAANIRFRWEYLPGSELFVVYNEQRNTLMRRFPGLDDRSLIVKVTRLFRL